MTNLLFPALVAGGVALASDVVCFGRRLLGVSMIGAGLLVASPAFADQNLIVADNGTVKCEASLRDLTRISLKDDKFASVSKVQVGSATEDFSVVNEPIRGDIYLSVPDGFKKPALSFFGTTQKGYVYKFICAVRGDEAQQIFVANADFEQEKRPSVVRLSSGNSQQENAGRLIKAMYENGQVEGFDQDWHSLVPVSVGSLKVQLVGIYRGKALVGSILKIQNVGEKPVELTEEQVAPARAIAVSIVNPKLGPKEATTAYVVEGVELGGAEK